MSITMGKSFAVFPIDVPGAVEAYAVDGSPADTVMLGLNAPIWAFDEEEEEAAAGGKGDGVDGGDERKKDEDGGEEEASKNKDDGGGGYSRALRRLASGSGSGSRRTLKHAASFSAAVEEALGELTLRSRDGSVVAVEGAVSAAAAAASSSASSSFFYPHSRFDLVASGTNKGDNLGHHCWYSGTVGAAREGALSALPSIAFSLDDHGAAGGLFF
jgi:broad specificity polyphosphatase/5'/3'-nucleotidase SurE